MITRKLMLKRLMAAVAAAAIASLSLTTAAAGSTDLTDDATEAPPQSSAPVLGDEAPVPADGMPELVITSQYVGLVPDGRTPEEIVQAGPVVTWTGQPDGSVRLLWSSESIETSDKSAPSYVGTLVASDLAEVTDLLGGGTATVLSSDLPLLCTTHPATPYWDYVTDSAAGGAVQVCNVPPVGEQRLWAALQIQRDYIVIGWWSTQDDFDSGWVAGPWASGSMEAACSSVEARTWRVKARGKAVTFDGHKYTTPWFYSNSRLLGCDV